MYSQIEDKSDFVMTESVKNSRIMRELIF